VTAGLLVVTSVTVFARRSLAPRRCRCPRASAVPAVAERPLPHDDRLQVCSALAPLSAEPAGAPGSWPCSVSPSGYCSPAGRPGGGALMPGWCGIGGPIGAEGPWARWLPLAMLVVRSSEMAGEPQAPARHARRSDAGEGRARAAATQGSGVRACGLGRRYPGQGRVAQRWPADMTAGARRDWQHITGERKSGGAGIDGSAQPAGGF
jgi:hypothetical protein